MQRAVSWLGLVLSTPRASAEAASSAMPKQQKVLKLQWSRKDFLQYSFNPLTLTCLLKKKKKRTERKFYTSRLIIETKSAGFEAH